MLKVFGELDKLVPGLGEVLRAGFVGELGFAVLSIQGIIAAIKIWDDRIKWIGQSLNELEMPDWTDPIKQADDMATAWIGIALAVDQTKIYYESASSQLERYNTAISAQEVATKKLIAAQKMKAEADLDLQRATGGVTPEEYDARKAIIEQGYNDANVQAEIDARNAKLAAKTTAKTDADDQARNAKAAAAAIRLPEDDSVAEAESKALEADRDTLRKNEDEAKARAQAISDAQVTLAQGGKAYDKVGDIIGTVPEAMKIQMTYGWGTKADDAKKFETDNAKNFEMHAADLDKEIERRKLLKEKRDRLRQQAEEDAKESEKLGLELQGETDPNKIGSTAWQNNQDRAAQQIRNQAAAEKTASDAIKSGTIDPTFKNAIYGGVNAQADIESLLRHRNQTAGQVEDEGEAARKKRDIGLQPLSDRESGAIVAEDNLHAAQDQLAVQRQVLQAMGLNAGEIMKNFGEMVNLHASQSQFNKSIADLLASLHQQLRQQQNNIGRTGL